MRVSCSFLVLAAMAAFAAAPAGAQYVALDGSYGEANGQVVDIPNNQPQQFLGNCVVESRCRGYRKIQATQMASTVPFTFKRPVNGVPRRAPLQTVMGAGVAVGAAFRIPASFFGQSAPDPQLPGLGAGPVLQNNVEWISTAYYARLPGPQRGDRLNNPALALPKNALTRDMRAQPAGPLPGQTGRDLEPTAMTVGGRKKIIHNMIRINSADSGTVTYTEGPNRFGGVMTALLDGYSDLNVRIFGRFDPAFPANRRPVLPIQRAGDYDVTAMGANRLSFMTRNGAGWAVPILGTQMKAPIFGPVPTIAGVKCNPGILPPQPANCNKPVVLPVARPTLGGPTAMGGLGPVPNPAGGAFLLDTGNFIGPANSTKFNFPFTTGTVAMVIKAVRGAAGGGTFTETLTGMGHDTLTTMGQVRNVGLVAGSYSNRNSAGARQLTFQLLGADLRLTPVPEVASASALAAGVALLGLATATRRRR